MPSIGATSDTCVPRITTRPSFRFSPVIISKSVGSGVEYVNESLFCGRKASRLFLLVNFELRTSHMLFTIIQDQIHEIVISCVCIHVRNVAISRTEPEQHRGHWLDKSITRLRTLESPLKFSSTHTLDFDSRVHHFGQF